MSSLSLVLVLAALTGDNAAATPAPAPAALDFVADDTPLVGTVYGIDAIDAQRAVFGQRTSLVVDAGQHEVWYSCPDAPASDGGSRLVHEFAAGTRYALVCRAGQAAEIRPVDDAC